MEYKNNNKSKDNQTALPIKYPQGYFKDKSCKHCANLFSPKAPSEHYCSDECKNIVYQDNFLIRNYGITYNDYIQLYNEQNSKCAICGQDGKLRASAQQSNVNLCVDHDHTTGKVRGLLCNTCNSALGQFKDSETILLTAINYLNKPKLEFKPIAKQVRIRASDVSDDLHLTILTDKLDNNLTRKELENKYNLSEAKIRGITELKTNQAKQAYKRYTFIKESATTISKESTLK